MVRALGAVSESYEITFTPFACARLSAGATAFGSSAEMMMALKPWRTAVSMKGTCFEPTASVGPL